MKTSRSICALAMIVGLGCHAPTTQTHWERTRESADPLDAARAACKAEALRQSGETSAEGLAAKQAVGVFAECMRRRGWELAEVAAHPAR